MGLYGPDEPRYASIGREMSLSGDYVTPRLWGKGWFEKPALLYWMIAAGFRAGLSSDLAPRVPVALFSVAFLIAFFYLVRREFGMTVAACSTMMLATSGMWIAYSELGVTDIPMSAAFGLALLFTLSWLRSGDGRYLSGTAAALGLAFLAKSGPPLVLALPALWFGRDKWRDLFRPRPLLLFLLIAAPWYITCALRNGPAFLQVLFVQQQFHRLTSPALQHVQPWWFYFKWLPLALFPWTPVLALLMRRDLYADKRIQFLMVTVAWGLLFFSLSPNKLPGYILPLLPALVIAAAVALDNARALGRVTIALSALACCAFPPLIRMMPAWMSRDPANIGLANVWLTVAALAVTAAVLLMRNRVASVALIGLLAATGYLWTKVRTFPLVDSLATARPVARELKAARVPACVKQDVPRDLRYGLNYYTETPLPDCGKSPPPPAFVYEREHRLVVDLPRPK